MKIYDVARAVLRIASQVLSCTLLCLGGTQVAANPVTAQQLEAVEAFLAVNPDNVDALYTYARGLLSQQRKAQARNAYLQILKLRPGQLATTMELAMLEHDMQMLEEARAGYRQVLQNPELDANVRTLVQQRLNALEQALSGQHWYGGVTVGLTAQHNANAGPDRENIWIRDSWYPLWDSARARSDVTRNSSASLGWRWRWNGQGDYLQASGSVLSALPQHLPNNRREQLSLQVGPTWSLARWGQQGILGVQAVFNRADVARAHYFDSQGVVVSSTVAVHLQHSLSVAVGHYREDHAQNSVHVNGNAQDHHRNEVTLGWQYALSADRMIYARLLHERRHASAAQHSLQRTGWDVGGSTRYNAPAGWGTGVWNSSIYASYVRRHHAAPDQALSLDQVQRARQTSIGLSQQVPLTEVLSATAALSWLRVRSNYDLSSYRDRSLNLSLTYAF